MAEIQNFFQGDCFLLAHPVYVRVKSSNVQATSNINLVGFWPVPPEFTWINCVQQALISDQVSIWQHSYVSLLLARRRHCSAELVKL